MRPHPHEPGKRIFELGKFHLEFGLSGLRTSGENVENELAAIQHFQAEGVLKLAHLAGAEIVVADDRVGIGGPTHLLHLSEFPPPDVVGRVRRGAPLHDLPDHMRSGRPSQPRQFTQGSHSQTRAIADNSNQYDALSPERQVGPFQFHGMFRSRRCLRSSAV